MAKLALALPLLKPISTAAVQLDILHLLLLLHVKPFRCEARSAAHELSHSATLLEQHIQCVLLQTPAYPQPVRSRAILSAADRLMQTLFAILTGLR